MSTSLIISDVHGRIKTAQAIMDSVPHDRVVFLGDFFDFFGDNYFDAVKTASWIKYQFDTNPKFITCIGNHDAAYRWPYSTCANCSGVTRDKSSGINHTLFKQDWDKFLSYYYHEEGNFMLSHAGFDPFIFKEDIRSDLSKLKEAFDTAISDIEGERLYHSYFGVGYARGGSQPHGGITWEDFNSINPVPQWNQIVGHTILSKPTIKYRHKDNKYLKTMIFDNNNLMSPHNANRMDTGDIVIGLDTNNRHYALITDGILSIHETEAKWLNNY